MNPNVIYDAVAGFLRSVNAVLSVIPALVWAIALALATGYGTLMHHDRDVAVSQRNVIQASYEMLAAKVIHQKNEAAALYRRLLAERDALQVRLNDAHNAQEKKDANNLATVDRLTRQLASVRLRDPYATGRRCSGASPESDAAPAAGDRAADGPDAPGLLSERTSEDLRALVRRADLIGAAYESARADALMCRQAIGAGP